MADVQRRRISRAAVLRLVVEGGEEVEEGKTYRIPPGGRLPFEIPEPLVPPAERSETGAVLFWSTAEAHLVVPPFPVEEDGTFEGWRVEVLRDLLERPRRVAVLLLRLSGFAVGVFEGDRLVSSKVGSRFVKGRHSKGGSSQARFARRREEQARKLFGKTCEVLRDQLDEHPRPLDHFLVGGDKRTLAAFEKECPYVEGLEPIRLHRVMDVGDPKKATLEALPRRLYESMVFSVRM